MKAHVALGSDSGELGCTGHGRCAVMAGEVYELDDEGYNVARGGFVDVPPGLEDAARLGARLCPEQIITIEE